MSDSNLALKKPTLLVSCSHGRVWDCTSPQVMSILNVTPDSFSDGGLLYDDRTGLNVELLEQYLSSIQRGEGLCVDVGGESTRPGALCVSVDEELKRVIPAVTYISTHYPELLISVDTRKATVAKAAIEAGAHIINDVSGGQFDADMFLVVAETGAGYVLMHSQGLPESMQNNPNYEDVVAEVVEFLKTQIHRACEEGLLKHQLMLDVGFGFGKSVDHNLALLHHLSVFQQFERPVLVGLSRKSFLSVLACGDTTILPEQRDELTAVAQTLAYRQGARVFRTHRPVETRQCLQLLMQV